MFKPYRDEIDREEFAINYKLSVGTTGSTGTINYP